jgi:glutathione S-transferase
MKLYTSGISPFSERVRIAILYKNAPVELVPLTPDQVHAPEYRNINPIGKIPALVTDDGQMIPESETILDYLEDLYPDPPLRPDSPAARARMRTVIRVFENYVSPPFFRLFEHADPSTRKEEVVADELQRWRQGLAYLAGFIDDARYAAGGRFSLADCAIFPGLILCNIMAPLFQAGDVLAEQPKLAGYFAKAKSEPVLSRSHDEMMAAVAAYYAEHA